MWYMSVLIVGSGPTGLVAALALTLNGIAVRLVDKRPEAATSSRALGLQARSMEVMASLGVADRIEAVSYRLRGARMMRGNRSLVDMNWVPPESPYPHTYVVPQAGLEQILLTRLAELDIIPDRGTEVTEVTPHRSAVTARLAYGSEITADWLIGADGAHSSVRTSAGIEFPQHTTGEVYWLADAHIDLPVGIGDSALWLDRHGPFMLMRLPGADTLWRVFADISDRTDDLPLLNPGVLEDLMNARGPHGARVHSVDWTSVFRTRMGVADRYRADRVFLAGDAAHVFPPFGGQGMNLGIQDAMNVSWRLAARIHGAPPEVLEDYERERRPVAQTTIREVDARRKLYALRSPLARTARDLLLRIGGAIPVAERRSSLQNSQLATTYRGVAAGGGRGPDPRPGDRAPDGSFGSATLHAHLGADHSTVLDFDPDAATSTVADRPGVRTLLVAGDDYRMLGTIYGVAPGGRASVLIRPDGHVGRRGPDSRRVHAHADAFAGSRA